MNERRNKGIRRFITEKEENERERSKKDEK